MNAPLPSVFVPDYYRSFHCIADRCRHSCCVGWAIDIDEDSFLSYQKEKPPFGDRLRASIAAESPSDPPHFILLPGDRCPFLNRNDLCDLILHLGESSLCNICRDHPRFRNFFSDRVEMGLGLCCEEAARVILTHRGPVLLSEISRNEDADLSVLGTKDIYEEDDFFISESDLLSFRSRLFAVLENRSLSFSEMTGRLLSESGLSLPAFDHSLWALRLRGMERLDAAWDLELSLMEKTGLSDEDFSEFDSYLSGLKRDEEYTNLLWYFLFRHLPSAREDGYLSERVLLSLLSVTVLRYLGACHFVRDGAFTIEDQVELCRMYSGEIEYSDENITAFLDHLS